MKIVVLDGYTENPGDLSWSALEQLGELVVYDRTSYEESDLVAERIGDADVAILNKTPISKATMDQCPNLKLIAVLATGYNVVDIAYAKEKGIPVCNVPNYGGYSVSQFAIALMLEACLHIGHHDRTVHEGKWQNGEEWCYWDYPLIEVAGKTYGLLGCGRIGIHTAEAAKALGIWSGLTPGWTAVILSSPARGGWTPRASGARSSAAWQSTRKRRACRWWPSWAASCRRWKTSAMTRPWA